MQDLPGERPLVHAGTYRRRNQLLQSDIAFLASTRTAYKPPPHRDARNRDRTSGSIHSTGAIFPKEMLAQLKVQKGDTLFTVETPDGILLTPYDPAVEKQLEAGREFMREYRDTFRALAK